MASENSRSLAGGSESFRGSYIKGSDELIDFTCDPCEERNSTLVEASFYCSVCRAFCCQSCNDVHKSFKANKNHQVYGRDEVDKWGQQTRIEMLPTEMCPEHPDEPLKILCLEHKTLCCSACVSLNHRACTNIEYVPKIAKGIKQSQDISIVGKTIDKFIKFIDETVTNGKESQTSLYKSKTEYMNVIKDVRSQINDHLNDLEKKACHEIEQLHNATLKDMQQHMKALGDLRDKLTELQKSTQHSSTNNESQLFIEMFITHQRLSEYKPLLHKLAITPQSRGLHVSINPKLQDILTIPQIIDEIKADTSTTQVQLPSIPPLPLLQTQLPSSPSDRAPTPPVLIEDTTQQQSQMDIVTNGRKINVKISSDKKDCVIKGSCQMPNGEILLTDNKNNKIKLLNTKYECTDYLALPAAPRDICCLNDTTAVVTGNNRTLNFLAITKDKMKVTKSQILDHDCYGIAYHNGQLFVTDSTTSVYIYDTSGNSLRHITPTDNNGKYQLSDTNHITVSHDGTKIYVCDNKGLVTLDIHGNHLSTYGGKNLKKARGVCVDSRGRVILCGYLSRNILQLDEGGGTLLNEQEIKHYPRSCCIDRYSTSLIVSMANFSQSYNYIILYDLK